MMIFGGHCCFSCSERNVNGDLLRAAGEADAVRLAWPGSTHTTARGGASKLPVRSEIARGR